MRRNLDLDEERVLEWFRKYAHGYRRARKRADILPFIHPKLTDRYFRLVVSSLKHQGHLASTSSRGYWAVPLCTTDRSEVSAALESIHEMKAKALDMLKGCGELEQKLNKQAQGQEEMALGA